MEVNIGVRKDFLTPFILLVFIFVSFSVRVKALILNKMSKGLKRRVKGEVRVHTPYMIRM